MKVLVTHPGRQHSHQAALALARAGMLAGYWAGVPALDRHRRRVPAALWRRFVRYAPVPLPEERVRWAPWVPALRRAGDRLPPPLAAGADFLACRLFDRWAAAGLAHLGTGDNAAGSSDGGDAPRAVMACEISARDTFRRARERGMVTVLDAPATHHRTQDRLHGFAEPPALHRRITAIKDEEIALADHVLVVSELARESYLEAGVPPGKVHCVPPGAEVALFAAAAGVAEEEREQRAGPASGVTFVFAGAASRVKGFDLLLDAFARVRMAEPAARLWAIGPRGDVTAGPGEAGGSGAAMSGAMRPGDATSGDARAEIATPGASSGPATSVAADLGAATSGVGRPGAGAQEGVSLLGSLPQAELAARFRAADCLVLPSRNESFGMVVPEALAAGLPVLASERTGASALVREGVNGWVVPAGDAGALASRMLWCAGHPAELRRMRAACIESAAAADWAVYRERLPALLRELVGEGEPSADVQPGALATGAARPGARR